MPKQIDGINQRPPVDPGPITPQIELTPGQMDSLKRLINDFRNEKNTNQQMDVVDKIWANLRPMVFARYIAVRPPVAARYIALPPDRMPRGFDPSAYDGKSGAELVALTDARVKPDNRDATGVRFPDDIVMFYLVAPPPPTPDSEQLARFNEVKKFDVDLNKTFEALLSTTKKVIDDKKVSDEELGEFEALHYAFDLAGKMFYDLVREYRKDYPLSADPVERRGDPARLLDRPTDSIPPTDRTPKAASDSSSLLGVQSAQKKKDE